MPCNRPLRQHVLLFAAAHVVDDKGYAVQIPAVRKETGMVTAAGHSPADDITRLPLRKCFWSDGGC